MNITPNAQKTLAGAAIFAAWYGLVFAGKLPADPLQTAFEAALATLGGHGTLTSLINLYVGKLAPAMGAQSLPAGTQVTISPPVQVLNTAAPSVPAIPPGAQQ